MKGRPLRNRDGLIMDAVALTRLAEVDVFETDATGHIHGHPHKAHKVARSHPDFYIGGNYTKGRSYRNGKELEGSSSAGHDLSSSSSEATRRSDAPTSRQLTHNQHGSRWDAHIPCGVTWNAAPFYFTCCEIEIIPYTRISAGAEVSLHIRPESAYLRVQAYLTLVSEFANFDKRFDEELNLWPPRDSSSICDLVLTSARSSPHASPEPSCCHPYPAGASIEGVHNQHTRFRVGAIHPLSSRVLREPLLQGI